MTENDVKLNTNLKLKVNMAYENCHGL